MANTAPLDPASLRTGKSASSRLVSHKSSPWFNVLAIVRGHLRASYTPAITWRTTYRWCTTPRPIPTFCSASRLVIALGFEFVNGFHDTANAVATVIYTNSMSPNLAVIWSGNIQFSRGAGLDRRRRIRDRLAAAGRADSAGRQRRRLCHGVRAAHRRHPMEFGHLVFWPSLVEFAYPHRLHHRRRPNESAHGGQRLRHQRRRLGSGDQDRPNPAVLAAGRIQRGVAAAAHTQGSDPNPGALQGARGQQAAAPLDSRLADPDLHRRELLSRRQRRPEGHGAHHADPHRHGADRLCAQSHHA